jgi:hypothetical protein
MRSLIPRARSWPTTSSWIEPALSVKWFQGSAVHRHRLYVEVGIPLPPLRYLAVEPRFGQTVAVGHCVRVMNISEP